MPEKPHISTSELATLWMTYQQKTMLMQMLQHFLQHADDEHARAIMMDLHNQITLYTKKIKEIFRSEGAAIPIGFTEKDVNQEAPKLFDNGFDIMYIRVMKQVSMGMHALHMAMAHREDIILLYREISAMVQDVYNRCTQYLLHKGLIPHAPYAAMPKSVEFVESTSYLGTVHLFQEKRAVNMIEVAHMYQGIEANIVGLLLIKGFAQCADEKEIREFFLEGEELSKSIVKEFSEVLLDSGLQTPAPAGGSITNSTIAPFSDKLMMYCISLLCTFSLSKNAVGTAFSLRNDIITKASIVGKDVFEYARKCAKIMVQHGWMEQPPQIEKKE